jgi:phospholipase/carboxylesterase
MQLGVVPDPVLLAELARRAFALPDVVERPTVVSVPGARALWLTEGAPIARPEAIVAGRELSHIHPDGSMHLALPAERAREAVASGWAEPHPIASVLGLDGLVLVYTPRTRNELDVLWSLLVESYRFVTGRDPRPDRAEGAPSPPVSPVADSG